MTSITTPRLKPPSATGESLRRRVDRSVFRARVLTMVGLLLLVVAVVVGGLFVVAVADALFVIEPPAVRVVLLAGLFIASVGFGLYRLSRYWRRRVARLAAAEQIDRAGGSSSQPVLRGLSLMSVADGDDLSEALRQRAEQRADELAESVKPRAAYPLSNLGWQGACIGLACLMWLALAVVFPAQFSGLVARAAMPWADTPPFSLTQLEPTWSPKPPEAGDDVLVSVIPSGMQPDAVDFIRLDGEGDEAERFAMVEDERGGFHHTLRRVESPIIFRLESSGRPTRAYTIKPTPRPPTEDKPQAKPEDAPGDSGESDGGTTTFDPDKAADRDTAAHPDAEALRKKIEQLLKDLNKARELAENADPSDLKGLENLAGLIDKLADDAETLSRELSAMQADLPPQAAAALADLQNALAKMKSSQLPNAPGTANPADPGDESADPADPPADPGDAPSPEDWINQAKDALKQDQQQIGKGLSTSSLPTESGTASGNPDGKPPIFFDPEAKGAFNEQGKSSDSGALPDAVMQQVPPRYRPLIRAYFDRLAQPEKGDKDAP